MPSAVAESSLRPRLRTVRLLLQTAWLALVPPARAPRLLSRCPLRPPARRPSRRYDVGRLRARRRLRCEPGSRLNDVRRLRARRRLRSVGGAGGPPAQRRVIARRPGLGPTSVGAIQVLPSVRQHRPVCVRGFAHASAEIVCVALLLHLRRLWQPRPCVHLRERLQARGSEDEQMGRGVRKLGGRRGEEAPPVPGRGEC